MNTKHYDEVHLFSFPGFHTPEEFFLDEKPAKFDWKSINPADYVDDPKKATRKQEYHKKVSVLIKLSFCGRCLHDYGHVLSDLLEIHSVLVLISFHFLFFFQSKLF